MQAGEVKFMVRYEVAESPHDSRVNSPSMQEPDFPGIGVISVGTIAAKKFIYNLVYRKCSYECAKKNEVRIRSGHKYDE